MKQTLNCMFTFIAVTMMAWSCNNSSQEKKQTAEVAEANTAAVDSFKTIYLWGSSTTWPPGTPFPIDLLSIDHAFATDYNPITGACPIDSNYWYCLGGGHPSSSGPTKDPNNSCYYQHDTAITYGQGIGNVNFAARLVFPNSVNANSCPDDFGNATGGLPWPYAAYGVCHQIANRAAYATYWKGVNTFVQPISLPVSLPGYRYSHFFYGTYGLQTASNFIPRINALGGNSSFVGDNGDSLERAWLVADFGQQLVDSYWADYQIVRSVIQAEVTAYVISITKPCGNDATAFEKNAALINKKMADLMQDKLLPLLGKDGKDGKAKYKKMFGFAPGKEMSIVDASHLRK